MKIFSVALVVALSLMGGGHTAFAEIQEPIEIVVPQSAGGPADIIGRLIADTLSTQTGRSAMVTNRPGGGTSIGARHVANARPDGATLLLISPDTILLQQAFQPSAPKLEDFRILAIAGIGHNFFYASSKHGWTSLQDFISAAKAEPSRYSIGVASGSTQHITAGQIQELAGISLIEVPFKGTNDMQLSIAGGHVDVGFISDPTALLNNPKVQILAVRASTRLPNFPDIPTFKENGIDVTPFATIYAVLAPKDVPDDIAETLSQEIAAAAQSSVFREKLHGMGYRPADMPLNEYVKRFTADQAKFRTLVETYMPKTD